MKFKQLIIPALALGVLAGCQSGEKAATAGPKPVTVKGHMDNASGQVITLQKGKNSWSYDRITCASDTIDADGNFELTFTPEKARQFALGMGRNSQVMYLESGMDIQVNADAKDLAGTIKMTGKGADINEVLVAYAMKEKELNEIYKTDNPYKYKEAEKFATWVSGRHDQLEALLSERFEKISGYDGYKMDKIQEVKLSEMSTRLTYARWYNPDVPEDFYALNLVDLKSPKLSNNPLAVSGSEMLVNIKAMKASAEHSEKDEKEDELAFELMKSEYTGELQLNVLRKYIMFAASFDYTNKQLPEMIAMAKKLDPSSEFNTKVDEMMKPWEKLKEGMSAFDFKFKDMEGKEVALSDYKGKLVFVDVWATWCGPCREELPYLMEIEEKYHGNKDVVFMSVSVDDTRAPWEKMVKDKGIGGVTLCAEGWENSLVKNYNIKGIPRFMMFDRDGNIISAMAPNPSMGAEDLIKKHL